MNEKHPDKEFLEKVRLQAKEISSSKNDHTLGETYLMCVLMEWPEIMADEIDNYWREGK